MKQTFSGYFCQSRDKNDDWGFEYYLCRFEPVSYQYAVDQSILVPPDSARCDDIFDLCDISCNLVPGKKYIVTIEEIK